MRVSLLILDFSIVYEPNIKTRSHIEHRSTTMHQHHDLWATVQASMERGRGCQRLRLMRLHCRRLEQIPANSPRPDPHLMSLPLLLNLSPQHPSHCCSFCTGQDCVFTQILETPDVIQPSSIVALIQCLDFRGTLSRFPRPYPRHRITER